MSLHSILDKGIFDVLQIKEVLQKNPSQVHTKSKHNLYYDQTPLERVLRYKKSSVELVKLLLQYGADVSTNSLGDTPLLLIAIYKNRNVEIIKALLDGGSRADRQCHGSSVLCTALESEVSFDVIKLLVERGGPLDRCNTHKSVMHCAVDGQIPGYDPKVFKLLLSKGADIKKLDCDGNSLLCYALGRGPEDSDVDLLLKAGVPVDACTKHPSALICGAFHLTERLVKQLLAAGASPYEVDEKGRTVLHIALHERCKTGAIRALLDLQTMDVNSVDFNGKTLLHVACANQDIDISTLELLLEHGARLDVKDCYGQTPLHCAIKKKVGFKKGAFFSILELLLKEGAQINAVDSNGDTVLDMAVNRKRGPELLHMLLLAGARMGETKEDIKKFLQYALMKYKRKVMLFRYPVSKVLLRFVLMESFFVEEILDCIENNYFEANCDCPEGYSELDEGRYVGLTQFVNECYLEWHRMKSVKVGPDCSVCDFVHGNKNYDLDLLLRLKPFETFHIYSTTISHRLGKSVMLDKLKTLKIFAVKECLDSSSVPMCVVLDYDSVCAIAKNLSEFDLLKLIQAFYAPCG